MSLSRRDFLRTAALSAAALAGARPLAAMAEDPADERRLREWVRVLRREGLVRWGAPLGRAVARVGELSLGSPYAAGTLDAYLSARGADPRREPLVLTLSRFDCVTLVESCIAVARVAASGGEPTWAAFGREVARMRYRGGVRDGYISRLHYFSEWIADGHRRGLVRDLGRDLAAGEDRRPLRFMTEHRGSYAALKDDATFRVIGDIEQRLDTIPRRLVPEERIASVTPGLRTGDVLAFATSLAGLDATHTGFAYRAKDGVMRVLHAPLSGGVVEVSRGTVAEYVQGLRTGTGILAARPLPE